MSLHEYLKAVELIEKDAPFYALIMAAMLKADDQNLRYLREHWPEIHAELSQRYHSRGGLLDDEREEVNKPIIVVDLTRDETPDGFSGDDEEV